MQNGVYDPTIIGDKHKWFSHQLDMINFKVWNPSIPLIAQAYADYLNKEEDSDNDSDEDSDLSIGSSHSSLNELFDEVCDRGQHLGRWSAF